jgi:hypothetical protein
LIVVEREVEDSQSGNHLNPKWHDRAFTDASNQRSEKRADGGDEDSGRQNDFSLGSSNHGANEKRDANERRVMLNSADARTSSSATSARRDEEFGIQSEGPPEKRPEHAKPEKPKDITAGDGVSNADLEQVGGTKCTTREALLRKPDLCEASYGCGHHQDQSWKYTPPG